MTLISIPLLTVNFHYLIALFPFKTLKRASEEAGSGATIHFVRGNNNSQGTHEETETIVLDKRILIELNNSPIVIQ